MTDDKYKMLLAEAQSLGIQYTGNDIIELESYIALEKVNRGRNKPVPCYGLSYDPTDRRCRICDLRDGCAELDGKPKVKVLSVDLSPIPCGVCNGLLEVELRHRDTDELLDYGCSTQGCPNRISVQCGWEDGTKVADTAIPVVVLKNKVKDIPEQPVIEFAESDTLVDKPQKVEASKVTKSKATKVIKKKATKKKVVKKSKGKVKTESSKAPDVKAEPVKDPPTKKKVKLVKKATKKKVVIKKTPLSGALKAPSRGVRYRCGKLEFDTLSSLVNGITLNRAWSPRRFFPNQDLMALKPGDVIEKTWKGKQIRIEVLDGKSK